ncbi:hypothetical protein I3842_01G102500 [Carya illinoinensis]|uniref:Uncharacterized protein n=1 Tax=Carya illinoinensis TaxID=32201 RepID=A0A922K4N3_CARIL|nr:hypothetical protein I3842_01G102500 [Carya illinoinensis]
MPHLICNVPTLQLKNTSLPPLKSLQRALFFTLKTEHFNCSSNVIATAHHARYRDHQQRAPENSCPPSNTTVLKLWTKIG